MYEALTVKLAPHLGLVKKARFLLPFTRQEFPWSTAAMKITRLGVFPLYCAVLMLVSGAVFAGGSKEDAPTDEQVVPEEAARIEVSDAVARVNGEVIPRSEFERVVNDNIERFEAQGGRAFDAAQRPLLERQVLDGMIQRELLMQESEKQGITVSDDDFAATLERFKGQFPSETAFQLALEQQGFSMDEFSAQLRSQMVIDSLVRAQVYDSISIQEGDIESFYNENPAYFQMPEQVSARHIILTTDGSESETQRGELNAQLTAIRQEIIDGADFAAVAQEKSQGPSAPNGGDLGTFARGQMVGEFDEVVFALEEGEISQPFMTQFGYHIAQVTKKIPAQTRTLDQSRDMIRQFITDQEQNRAAQVYLEGLRGAATVEELIQFSSEEAPAQE